MNPAPRVFTEETRGKTLIVTPVQNLREFEFGWIEGAIDQVLARVEGQSVRNVVVDLCNTDFYGSTAVGFFVKLWRQVCSIQGKMAICHASPHEVEVLKQARLDRSWPICESLEEALAAVDS